MPEKERDKSGCPFDRTDRTTAQEKLKKDAEVCPTCGCDLYSTLDYPRHIFSTQSPGIREFECGRLVRIYDLKGGWDPVAREYPHEYIVDSVLRECPARKPQA